MSKPTKTEIERILSEYGHDSDMISTDDDGVVSVRTWEARGDGCPVPWRKTVGTIGEIRDEWSTLEGA